MPARKAIKGKQLFNILLFGVIFAVVAVGSLAYWGVREIRRDAANVAVESSARGLAGAVTVLVNSVAKSNDEIGIDILADLKPDGMRKAIKKAFKEHPSLTSVMISDSEGLRYMLSRRASGCLELIPERGEDRSTRWTLWKGDGTAETVQPEASYDRHVVDSTLAEEFQHMRPGLVNWHSSYRFHAEGESWLTASVLIDEDGQTFMASYIFPIDAVISQLGGAEKGSAEKVFLFWSSGKVLPVTGYTGVKVVGDRASQALEADKVDDPVIAGAATLLASKSRDHSAPFSYVVGGETWWAYVLPLSVFGDTMSLGVAVPRTSIVSTLTSDTFLQVFSGVLAIFAAIVLFILYRNRARIEALGLRQKAARSGDDILRLIADGESSTLEFKQTLRFNLKAGKNGKEIEHASMKSIAGFLNSDGGTLLVGVADNGTVTGFEEDQLGSDDKALLHFNNLVNQHVGTEFARYLDTAIIEVQGKHVLRAYCLPAAAPAILKSGKGEEFYIRSGPASRQLTLSQFYEWLQKH